MPVDKVQGFAASRSGGSGRLSSSAPRRSEPVSRTAKHREVAPAGTSKSFGCGSPSEGVWRDGNFGRDVIHAGLEGVGVEREYLLGTAVFFDKEVIPGQSFDGIALGFGDDDVDDDAAGGGTKGDRSLRDTLTGRRGQPELCPISV